MPLVTVVIPAYNHERFIGEAVESVFFQTIQDWEIIVVDDGSTDRTAEVVQRHKDHRLRLVRQSNSGAHNAMNRGITEARGVWIAFLNSDDRFRKDKLERHLQVHESSPDMEASASRVRYIYESGTPASRYSYYAVRYRSLKRVSSDASSLFSSLLIANHLITTSSLFARRDTLLEIGGFAGLRYVHDWCMFLTLAARQRFVVIEEDLSDYRRHHGNTIREDDVTGQIEDNLVLAWQASAILDRQCPTDIGIEDVFIALRHNPRVDYELLWVFTLWKLLTGGDMSRYLALLGEKNHFLLQLCHQRLRGRRITNSLRRFAQKINVVKEMRREIFKRLFYFILSSQKF